MLDDLPEEMALLKDTVRRFVDRELIPLEGKSLVDGEFDKALEAQLTERCKQLGLWQIDVPEEFGGQGLGLLARTVIWSELGRTVALPTRGVRILGPEVRPVLYALEGDMRERYLYPVMRGEKESCFAQTEPDAGSDPGSMRTLAVRSGETYVINGVKRFITGADKADFMILMAATDRAKGSRGGISCFIVDMNTPGVKLGEKYHTLTGETPWEVILDNVTIPASHCVGAEGAGFALGQKWLGSGRLKQGARALGATRRCLELAATYAKQRVTFGKPLSDRQSIQWRLTDTYVALEAATLLVHRAAARADRGEDIRNDAFVVKLYCTEMAWNAADMCLQVHGGLGLTSALPVERLWRDQRSHMITEGTPEIMRMAIARHVLREFAA
ncbi:MAG: acyl-CoA dehydrogenase family protein [Beijerinckiaceae bacterium]|nr:acyl-CoA dehydrogenase family protein [Beijerinckiaceae bacterium]